VGSRGIYEDVIRTGPAFKAPLAMVRNLSHYRR
jgi:hypothetical protein